MLSFRRWLLCAALASGLKVAAQPPLTPVQDVLYIADGSRFNGLVTIAWRNFESSDTSNIGAQTVTLPITNGILFVQLVPTTTAATAAGYTVQYNSNTRIQFTEVWVVPPSTTPLRVRDVRLAPGAVTTPGTPAANSITVQISDVTGLPSALSLRPTEGTGYNVSRAAIINAVGSIDGAVGTLSDCLHVDGTSGPCGSGGSGGSSASFVDGETPAGAINSANSTFTLLSAPSPASSLSLFRNGLLQQHNLDFSISGSTISFLSGAVPQTGDSLLASYRLSVSLPGVGFVDSETPAGSINGVNTAFTLVQTPNPSSSLLVYRNGLRERPSVEYTVSGNSLTFLTGFVPQTGDIIQTFYRIAQ